MSVVNIGHKVGKLKVSIDGVPVRNLLSYSVQGGHESAPVVSLVVLADQVIFDSADANVSESQGGLELEPPAQIEPEEEQESL